MTMTFAEVLGSFTLRVFHDANDFNGSCTLEELAANRIVMRKEMLRHGLIDYRHHGRLRAGLGRAEIATQQNGYTNRCEILWIDRSHPDIHLVLRLRHE